jgi:hypothetical protein
LRFPSSRRIRAVLAVGPLVALSWAGAFSAFTDNVNATSSFSTGSVTIRANDQTGTVAFTSLSMSGMTPGTVRYTALRITNGGSADFNYAMAAATTGSSALAGALTIGVKLVPSASCGATEYTASTTALSAEAAGVDGAAIAARPLASGTSEFLCFKVQLPSSASNSLQGLTTNATFSFNATA